MKRALIYVGVLIIITGLLILFVSKNYPENILELCLGEYQSPEQIRNILDKAEIFDYFNVYDIFSNEGKMSVYSGNLNLFLHGKEREDIGLTYDTKEAIMGSKFAEKNVPYYPLGEKYKSAYGVYDITCILKGSDRAYYRDLDILKTAKIKGQKLYVSTVSKKKFMMSQYSKIYELKYHGMKIDSAIAYVEIANSLKKLATFLMIIMSFLIFALILRVNKDALKKMISSYKETKYDLEFQVFLKLNYKTITKQVFIILLQALSIIFILYSVSNFINVAVSYNIDFASLKSITDAIMSFVNLLAYYFTNGFTEASWLIIKIIMIYVFGSVLFWLIINKYENVRLRKSLKKLEKGFEKA